MLNKPTIEKISKVIDKNKLSTSGHPDHSIVLTRLKKIRGQIGGIESMIEEKRYCVDIMTQIQAARSALNAVEATILKNHVEGCLKEAASSSKKSDIDVKIEELVQLLTKRI